MNLCWIDWTILLIALAVLQYATSFTRKACKGVADFLSANRSAGRYLLSISQGMAATGVITCVALFEMYSEAGLPPAWWGMMLLPVEAIILLSGWVVYRFRETRALTMAQFFEMRYSRRFRVFAGSICFLSGILNFGLFPAVAARFFMHFCGFPTTFQIPGVPFRISTFVLIMVVNLVVALRFVITGGQISVMVTDCVQGILTMFALILISITILLRLRWPEIMQALQTASRPGASLIHPYQTSRIGDFDVFFFLINIFFLVYGHMSWQGSQAYNSSARNPHEARMGGIISVWWKMPGALASVMLPIAAVTIMHTARFSTEAAAITANLEAISDKTLRNQMFVPIAMAQFLPIGIKGLLLMVMLFYSWTTDDTYLHSWGSIFVQDVFLPLRKGKPLSPEQHIRLLRWSVVGVAVFAFVFSLLYQQKMKLYMLMAATGTIWVGGAGAVIVGGLYWKRGTTQGAYAAMIVSAIAGVVSMFSVQIWQALFHRVPPFNAQWMKLYAALTALACYVVVSLITGRKARQADMDKLLHRGKWAVAPDVVRPPSSVRRRWLALLGIREEFTLRDTIQAASLMVWRFGWLAVLLTVTAVHFTLGTSTEWWTKFWQFYLMMELGIGVPATIWFMIGGIRDIKALFATLRTAQRDETDDGRVIHEPEPPAASSEVPPRPAGSLAVSDSREQSR